MLTIKSKRKQKENGKRKFDSSPSSPLFESSQVVVEAVREVKAKKPKIESACFLIQLPNELVLEIISYLLGDLIHLKGVDVTSFRPEHSEGSDLNPIEDLREKLKSFIPPLENIKAFTAVSMVDRATFILMRGVNESVNYFEEYLLGGFVFFQKLNYWMKTTNIEDWEFVKGKFTLQQAHEMGDIQNVVQAYERGLLEPIKIENNRQFPDYHSGIFLNGFDYDAEYSFYGEKIKKKRLRKKNFPNLTKENAKEILKERINRLNITTEEYTNIHKPIRSVFEMFLTHAINMSLNLFFKQDYESFDPLETRNKENLRIFSDYQLRTSKFTYFSDIESTKKEYKERIELSHTGSNNRNGYEIREKEGWAMFLKDSKTPLETNVDLSLEDIDLNSVRERLSRALILKIMNIVRFDPLQNFKFPEGIRVLSISFKDAIFNTDEPFFSGCTFPGVRVLELSNRTYNFDNMNETCTINKKLISTLLSKKVFPKLEYLLLDCIQQAELLRDQKELLGQLFGINIVFEHYTKGWHNLGRETITLNYDSNLLKFVGLDMDLDTRSDYVSANAIRQYYEAHSCFFTIGEHGVARVDHDCLY